MKTKIFKSQHPEEDAPKFHSLLYQKLSFDGEYAESDKNDFKIIFTQDISPDSGGIETLFFIFMSAKISITVTPKKDQVTVSYEVSFVRPLIYVLISLLFFIINWITGLAIVLLTSLWVNYHYFRISKYTKTAIDESFKALKTFKKRTR